MKSLIVAPILIQIKDTQGLDDEELHNSRTYQFYLGVVLESFTIEVNMFEVSQLVTFSIIIITLILSLCLSTYCVFQTSHHVIKPLRILNTRMMEILQQDNYDSVNLDSKVGTCKEISDLQEQFNDLISDYKFTQNEFMKQESDVIALIDLA